MWLAWRIQGLWLSASHISSIRYNAHDLGLTNVGVISCERLSSETEIRVTLCDTGLKGFYFCKNFVTIKLTHKNKGSVEKP